MPFRKWTSNSVITELRIHHQKHFDFLFTFIHGHRNSLLIVEYIYNINKSVNICTHCYVFNIFTLQYILQVFYMLIEVRNIPPVMGV